MSSKTVQRALVNQFMSITGVNEKVASKVSRSVLKPSSRDVREERKNVALTVPAHARLSRLRTGRWIRRVRGKTNIFLFKLCIKLLDSGLSRFYDPLDIGTHYSRRYQ